MFYAAEYSKYWLLVLNELKKGVLKLFLLPVYMDLKKL
ncbi:hypothetical protein JFP55_pF0074 (plasmid) [Clostridium perfringens]|uniref:Uncharacterized protein n=1 Tax=Clostridium perfringens TaxID=1502 RepID=A0A140GQ50_CLOPF|nr:hypothetical protein JFP838_pC0077 [Clostridium perfringens]AMN30738.1 hypothetical protein JFP55_pF0074 [Clostridium perfringens]